MRKARLIIGVLLSVCMVFTMMPFHVLAAPEQPAITEQMPQTETV